MMADADDNNSMQGDTFGLTKRASTPSSPDIDIAEGRETDDLGGGVPEPSSSFTASAEPRSGEPGVIDSDNWIPPVMSAGGGSRFAPPRRNPPLLPWNYYPGPIGIPRLPLGHGCSGHRWVRPRTASFPHRAYPPYPIVRCPNDRRVETYYTILISILERNYETSDFEGVLFGEKPKPKQD